MKSLVLYLVIAMLSWSPAKDHVRFESETETLARYEAIATDIATVVLDPDEAPLYDDADKAETALQVAGVGFFESRYWAFVDDGSCNRLAWKRDHGWAKELCDGGRAWTIWQIQANYTKTGGIELDGDSWRYGPTGYRGPALVKDRRVAARVALHMMRGSLRKTGSLCGYTGEKGPCPKAKERRDIARSYLLAHPFKGGGAELALR